MFEKVAFIGTGVMGSSMAKHLLQKGYTVNVFNRTKEKALALKEHGAIVCDSIKEAVKDVDVVFSIVGFPQDVEQIYLSDDGILNNVKAGTYLVDMTTSSPELAKEIYQKGKDKNLFICDAPVTGGDVGAKNGTLTVLFGGDKDVYVKLQDLISAFAKKFVYFGEAGCGQLAKAANQIAVAGTMFSLCESLAFAKATGLDEQVILDTLGGGAAASFSLTSYGPRILKNDYKPGFFLKHFVKDLKIAIEVARSHRLKLECVELALKLYSHLEQEGLGDLGTQALYKCYVKLTNE